MEFWIGMFFFKQKVKGFTLHFEVCGLVFCDEILSMLFFLTKSKRISSMFWSLWVLIGFSTCFVLIPYPKYKGNPFHFLHYIKSL